MTARRTSRASRRRALTVLGVLGVCAALGVAPAIAAWSTSGGATATTTARSLATPAAPTVASTTANSVSLTGTLPAGQLAGTTYAVRRGGTTVCTPSATPWSCTDTGLAGSTTYAYTLVAGLAAWSATSGATTASTSCTAPDTYVVVPSTTTPTAGTAFTLTLTAKRCDASTDTGYTGSKAVTFAGASSSPSGKAPSYPATVTFANGVGTASVTLYAAESVTLSATLGAVTGSAAPVTVVGSTTSGKNLSLSGVTTKNDAKVTLTCSELVDPAVARTCVADVAGNTNGKHEWAGTLSLVDPWGNPTAAVAPVSVTITSTPAGAGTATNPTVTVGQTSAPFAFTKNSGAITLVFSAPGVPSLTITNVE